MHYAHYWGWSDYAALDYMTVEAKYSEDGVGVGVGIGMTASGEQIGIFSEWWMKRHAVGDAPAVLSRT